MGVDFFDCKICEESVCDCGPHGWCGKCGAHFCEECFEEQKLTYNEDQDDKLCECDLCSNINRNNRIKEHIHKLINFEGVPKDILRDLIKYSWINKKEK